ncbi:MAG: NAD-dependent malic enzyme [Cyanobacteria bacterium J003]|uniref:NAD-dependent malic enzyme n=1 Tax=Thermosynechococcus sp. M3746_W2019_013 TaxID=2747806 RepID=UPI000F194E02|nr:NAD-dependent malic enzyme [Thermosynechococcus sp. M3746_W2019_013]RMH65611.1 MAG: NAD-dependent malic enzyme [Cyanobacteria bacterium J003]HIK23643.1 NAD-dependent malic enzyme [Thermosynechococcus sp. M3746_W2019_013]
MVKLTPTPAYSLTLRLETSLDPTELGTVLQIIGGQHGQVDSITLIEKTANKILRELVVVAASRDHAEAIVNAVKSDTQATVLEVSDRTFRLHEGGKITVKSKHPLQGYDDLAMAYTPGVGRVSQAIADDPDLVHKLTIKSHTIAIVSDGSAVLGLGNIGPEAALPVMEGKAMLFQEFAGLDAFPICLATQEVDEIVATVKRIAPVFGGINLEDISAPRCFEIEARLQEELDIPVFHDDQHGTAIVTLAALKNALQLVGKSLETVRIVINGAGAAGIAVARLLRKAGAKDLVLCNRRGILSVQADLTPAQQEFAVAQTGTLADALVDADVFIGLSAPGVLTVEMVQRMAKEAIVFAMANPVPEIQPELISNHVAVVATGRSDYPNQINNVLAFPGVFKGTLACRAPRMTEEMFLAAAEAIAALVSPSELQAAYIIPSVFDPRVAAAVAQAVEACGRSLGLARA